MPRATALLREKVIDEHGNILELVIWSVPTSSRSPSGVRYRLAFVRRDDDEPAVLRLDGDGVVGAALVAEDRLAHLVAFPAPTR